MTFTETPHCLSRAHCATCRSDAAWRSSMQSAMGWEDGHPCPIGLPIVGQRRGLGDWLARLTHWLRIKRRSGCGCSRRQAWLNRWGAWLGAGVAASFLIQVWAGGPG